VSLIVAQSERYNYAYETHASQSKPGITLTIENENMLFL